MPETLATKVGFIGAGHMGRAIMTAWQTYAELFFFDINTDTKNECLNRISASFLSLPELCSSVDVLVIAVKPQHMDELLAQIRKHVSSKHLVISIVAGVTTARMEAAFLSDQQPRVIRTMPNLPVRLQKGVTAFCQGETKAAKDKEWVQKFFAHIGRVFEVSEDQMDAVTALSGSGPAYVFHFAEILEAAAKQLQLPTALAREMILATLEGSVAMLLESKEEPHQLREQVTSKGGTTAAALAVLNDQNIERIYKQALTAAAKRAQELSV